MDFDQALHFLSRLENYEKRPPEQYSDKTVNLELLRDVLTEVGDPQDTYPSVHIAGTKGKGSTAIMVESILGAQDIDVGTYTSPHLVDVRDRIRVNGKPIDPSDFAVHLQSFLNELDISNPEEGENDTSPVFRLTYFEFLTGLAMYVFREEEVDASVFEVGLGGRLDATNLLTSNCTVITSIGMDHTEYLGDSLEEIAREKGGIIQKDTPVIISETKDEPLNVLQKIAAEKEAPVSRFSTDFQLASRRVLPGPGLSQQVRIRTSSDHEYTLRFGMPGEAQARNLTTAVEVCDYLHRNDTFMGELLAEEERYADALSQTLRVASRTLSLPGRFQLLEREPPVVLDVAHNPISCQALKASIQETSLSDSKTLLFAVSGNKNWKQMLDVLIPLFDRVILTSFPEDRAQDPESMGKWVSEEWQAENQIEVTTSPVSRLDTYINEHTKRPLIVTGSCYLVGHVLRQMDEQGED